MTEIEKFVLDIGDVCLGWTLLFSHDGALLLIAFLTASVLVLLRFLLINKFEMNLIRNDLVMLKGLMRESRHSNDSESIVRIRMNRVRILWMKVKMEIPAVILSTILFSSVLIWGEQRLNWHPIKSGEPFLIRIELPASSVDQVCHIVPVQGIESANGWIRQLTLQENSSRNVAVASWNLTVSEEEDNEVVEREIVIRVRDEAYHHMLSTDPNFQSRIIHADTTSTVVLLKPYLPFGISKPNWIALSPWCCAFLTILAPLYFLGNILLSMVTKRV